MLFAVYRVVHFIMIWVLADCGKHYHDICSCLIWESFLYFKYTVSRYVFKGTPISVPAADLCCFLLLLKNLSYNYRLWCVVVTDSCWCSRILCWCKYPCLICPQRWWSFYFFLLLCMLFQGIMLLICCIHELFNDV